jgi:hypothetical protein
LQTEDLKNVVNRLSPEQRKDLAELLAKENIEENNLE